jgi:prophage regulatory protein
LASASGLYINDESRLAIGVTGPSAFSCSECIPEFLHSRVFMSTSPARFMRFPEVRRTSGYSKSRLYVLIANGQFPAPVKLGDRAVGWISTEIEEWVASRIAASRPAKSESTGGDGSTPQSKVPLPTSRRRSRFAEEASQMEAATRQPGQGAEAGEG